MSNRTVPPNRPAIHRQFGIVQFKSRNPSSEWRLVSSPIDLYLVCTSYIGLPLVFLKSCVKLSLFTASMIFHIDALLHFHWARGRAIVYGNFCRATGDHLLQLFSPFSK